MKNKNGLIRIFTDGSGMRPDGKGSGFAWLREDTSEKKVERVDGLTNNVAEYRAIIAALQAVPEKSTVEILTDSMLVASQLRKDGVPYRILDSKLLDLSKQIESVARKRKLAYRVTWISRRENLAGRLL